MKFDKDGDRETLPCGHELNGTFGRLRPGDVEERCPTEVSPIRPDVPRGTLRRNSGTDGDQVTHSPSHPSGLDLNQTSGAGSISRVDERPRRESSRTSECSTWNTPDETRKRTEQTTHSPSYPNVPRGTSDVPRLRQPTPSPVRPSPSSGWGLLPGGDEKASVLSPGKGQRRSRPPALYSPIRVFHVERSDENEVEGLWQR
jgi:hypothetical protein